MASDQHVDGGAAPDPAEVDAAGVRVGSVAVPASIPVPASVVVPAPVGHVAVPGVGVPGVGVPAVALPVAPAPASPTSPVTPMPREYVEGLDVVSPINRQRRLPRPFARFQLGLRSRAALALGLGALLISVAVSVLTYVVARKSLMDERRGVIQELVFDGAVDVQSRLADEPTTIDDLVEEQSAGDLFFIVVRGESVYDGRSTKSLNRVPEALQDRTRSMTKSRGALESAYQITRYRGKSELVIGVPLRTVGAEYYGIASMNEVENRLRNLARTLAVAAILTSLGAAMLGRAVSRRMLRPLSDVAGAAGGISSGRLDTRLELIGDVDLDPLLRSFNEMASSLQNRVEREARFASDVSHELRTPLTALVTAARLLDGRRDELSERGQKTLDVLVTQTVHFERLVLDLLEMSRFDAGAATLHAEIVNLPDLLRQVIAVNESDTVVVIESLDPIEVGIDKRRVERMVANLLQNAANYAGGATTVRVSQSDGVDGYRRIRIAVDDAGPGVPVDERDAIFERFRRGQSHLRGTSSQKGTGLGLSLVRAHANLHGGTVWVEDSPTDGARFVVDISEVEVDE